MKKCYKDDEIAARRALIADFRLCGNSLDSICEKMANSNKRGAKRMNGQPWSRETIAKDLQNLAAMWRDQATSDVGDHIALQFQRLEEVTRRAFETDEMDLILKAHDRIARLLGLDQPQRIEQTSTIIEHGIVPMPDDVNDAD